MTPIPSAAAPDAIGAAIAKTIGVAQLFEEWAAEDEARGIADSAACNRQRAADARAMAQTIEALWGRLEAAQSAGVGLELAHRDGKRFALVLPEPGDEAGRWRYQRFEATGMTGHRTFGDAAAALVGAIDENYTQEAPGALERLAAEPLWAAGCRIAEIVQDMHRGRITMDEANRRAAPVLAEISALSAV